MAIIDALERGENLTGSEQVLATFILEHSDEAVRMSISQLAEATYSSNATIIRLCRKLGLSGYRDFRVLLATELERRRSSRGSIDADHPFGESEGVPAVISSLALLLKRAIDDCYAAISAEDVIRAARIIRSAPHTFLFATGDSQVSALSFANMLLKLGIHIVNASQYGEDVACAYTAQPGDAALVVSYSGKILNGPARERIFQTLAERGVQTIWVSASEKPFGFDVGLRFPGREGKSGRVATFYSQTCIRFVLDCIYGAIWSFDYEGNTNRKASYDDMDVALQLLLCARG